jgi:GAF domain-containing protein
MRSVLCAPLVTSDEAFALIYLENRQVTNCFTEDQRDLLDEVCALAAPRLRAAVAMHQAQRRAEALEHAHSQSDGILTADPGMESLLSNGANEQEKARFLALQFPRAVGLSKWTSPLLFDNAAHAPCPNSMSPIGLA